VLRIKFSGGRQFSSPKSPTSFSCKTLAIMSMNKILSIIYLLIAQNLSGQIQFGTYTPLDTTVFAGLIIYTNNKFEFHDTRSSDCWRWVNYKGSWKIVNDTIVFYWNYEWSESADTVLTVTNHASQDISLTFVYDDGDPIQNAEACYACSFIGECKKYYSDNNGKIMIPNITCVNTEERRLYYAINTSSIRISSNSIHDVLTNEFTIVMKRNPKSKTHFESKKYLVRGGLLIEIDNKDNVPLNWGDLKYSANTYSR
jgi:hypothetical protein